MDIVLLAGNTNTRIIQLTKHSFKEIVTFRTNDLEKMIGQYACPRKTKAYFASVVPEASRIIRRFFEDSSEITWRDFPHRIKVKRPDKVGIDRLLNAAGAWSLAKSSCVIIDAGSAITIDFVNRHGDFEGGVIFPGEHLMIQSLRNLALLKKVKVSKCVSIIGKDTSEAIGSGITFGISFLVTGYIKVAREKNPQINVFFTGGQGRALWHKVKAGHYNKNLPIAGVRSILYGI